MIFIVILSLQYMSGPSDLMVKYLIVLLIICHGKLIILVD